MPTIGSNLGSQFPPCQDSQDRVRVLFAAQSGPSRALSSWKENSTYGSQFLFPLRDTPEHAARALQVIDEKALADECEFSWYNQTLCKVNDSVIRLGVIQGAYHRHRHEQDDEFFYVVGGHLVIDLEDRIVELSPRQKFVVPRERCIARGSNER